MKSSFLIFHKYFIFILSISIPSILNSQEASNIPDSLKNKSAEEIVSLINFSSTDEKERIYEKTFLYLQNKKKNTSQKYLDLGEALYVVENYKKSLTYFVKAAEIAKEIEDNRLLFISNIKQSHCYFQSSINEKAIEAYFKALTIAKENKNIDQEIIAYSGLIAILPLINKEDKAIDFSLYTLNLIEKASFKNKKNHVRLLTTISDAYLAKEDYDAMLVHVEKGIALAKKLDYKEGLLDLYIKKGRLFYHKKEWSQAFEYLYKAETIIEKNNIVHGFFPIINTNYHLARCFYDLKKYDEGIIYLLKTVSILKEKNLENNIVIATYNLLAKCYLETDKKDEAIHFLKKVIELKDHIQNKKNKAINEFNEQDSEKLLTQISGLQGQHQIDKKEVTYMLISVVIVITALFLVLIAYTKKQKSNQLVFKKLIQQISALELEKNNATSNKKVTKSVVIDDNTVEEVIKRLDRLEEQEYFLSPNSNLRSMAKKAKTNATYLSSIINSSKGKNFNDYINDLRIEYALERLKNDKMFRSFSIKGIATELGYKSDYSFTKHFKVKTGLNPSYYIKEINKLVSEEENKA